MYLIVMDDFNVYKSETITKDDINAADDGIIDIIRLSNFSPSGVGMQNPMQYADGEWHEIRQWRIASESDDNE